eukprot:1156850-Pelagomonas_calceolata.AAC.2
MMQQRMTQTIMQQSCNKDDAARMVQQRMMQQRMMQNHPARKKAPCILKHAHTRRKLTDVTTPDQAQ